MTTAKKAPSKTKLLATRNKPKAKKIFIQNADGTTTAAKPEHRLFSSMVQRYADCDGDVKQAAVSFTDLMDEYGMNNRNTGYRNAWKDLVNVKSFIMIADASGQGPTFTTEYQLTAGGIGHAVNTGMIPSEITNDNGSTKAKEPKSNAELHDAIKSKCMNNRGHDIFRLLLTKGPLTRKELAEGHLNISYTGAYFSYALAQLKELEYVEKDPNGKNGKLRLTSKCFVSESDRATFLEVGKAELQEDN